MGLCPTAELDFSRSPIEPSNLVFIVLEQRKEGAGGKGGEGRGGEGRRGEGRRGEGRGGEGRGGEGKT